MKLKKVLIGILNGAFLLGGTYLLAQQVPKECVIVVPGGKMPSVKFLHAKHVTEYKVSCKTCHHKTEDFTKGVQKCSECHGLKEGKEGAPRAMLAFHKNCVNCHKKVNTEQQKNAPIKCNECHKKES